MTLSKNQPFFRVHKATACPPLVSGQLYGFVCFGLLVERISAVANRLELRCKSKATRAIVLLSAIAGKIFYENPGKSKKVHHNTPRH